jgi:TorA maturation chaperone TorD
MSESKKNVETLKPLIEARGFAYDFLRRAFWIEPSRDYLKVLTQEDFIEAFPFQGEEENIAKGIQILKDYLRSHKVLEEEEYGSLHWDYTRLFIGPYELPASPWESAYLNKERLLFQEETLEVRKAYLKYSFLPVAYGHEADDHVGIELDFMYRLNELTLLNLEKTETEELQQLLMDQKSFLEDHLLKWIFSFSQAVIKNANTEFYQGLANLMQGYLTLDLRALNELLEINSSN